MPSLAAFQHADRYDVVHLLDRDGHASPFPISESFPLKHAVRAFCTFHFDPPGLNEPFFLALLLKWSILHGFQRCLPRRVERADKKLVLASTEGCTTDRCKREEK